MTIIGTFTRRGDGFTGTLDTLTLHREVEIRPIDKAGDRAPDYRVTAGTTELGVAWHRSGRERDYLSLKLDDPSFPAPVFAHLLEPDDQGRCHLLWSRYRPH